MKKKLFQSFLKGMASIFPMDSNPLWEQYFHFRDRSVADALGADWRKTGQALKKIVQ